MDTKKESATADVPTFKIARVGNDRKKKKGGFSFLRSGGSRGSWSGASGGAGAGGSGGLFGLGVSLNQLVTIVAMLGAMASGVAFMVARDARNAKAAAPKKAEVFAKSEPVKIEGDTSNLQGNKNTIPNSLGYLSGSKDGLTDEERAKRDADAAAAAEAQRLADEEAARKAAEAEKNAAKEPAAVDPMAAAAAAGAGGPNGPGGFGKKFGALSAGVSGGSALAGGAGMSGGMNGSFGRGVGIKGGASGRISGPGTTARPKQAARASSKMGKSSAKGFARKQLTIANAWSRRAANAGKAGEASSVSAGNAFDSGTGAGTAITGGGMAPGAPGTEGSSSGGGTPSGSGGGGGGGALSTPEVEPCGGNNSLRFNAETGGCDPILEVEGKSAQEAIDIMCKIAMGLLVAIAAIAVIKGIAEGSILYSAMGPVLGGIIAALGLIIAGLGVAIMAMGSYLQGAVFAGVGAIIATFAMIPYAGTTYLTSGTMLISAGAGLILAPLAGMLDGHLASKNAPEAAQQ